MNRWIGIAVAVCMLGANAALVMRDLAPMWLAGAPPNADEGLLPGQFREMQLGLFDERGKRIGRNWTVARLSNTIRIVKSTTVLESIRLPNGLRTPRVRIASELTYQEGTTLDQLDVRIHGLGVPAHVHGQLFGISDFTCTWEIGELRGDFVLPTEATRALSDVFKPFDRMPGLTVGRSWTVRLINPLARILPGWQGGVSVESLLVRVTGREEIDVHGARVECFVVEANNSKAWVDDTGEVLRQRIVLPVLGELTLERQPFDRSLYEAANDTTQFLVVPAAPNAPPGPRRDRDP